MRWALVLLLLAWSAPGVRAEDAVSLLAKRDVPVWSSPEKKARVVGKVAAGTRIGWKRAIDTPKNERCPRWYQVEPRGWVCADDDLEPSSDQPSGIDVPRLAPGQSSPRSQLRIVPRLPAKVFYSRHAVENGKKMRVIRRAIKVSQAQRERIGEREYFRTDAGFVDAEHVELRDVSELQGVRLDGEGAPQLPFAWLQSRRKLRGRVLLFATPNKRAAVVRLADTRSVVPVLEVSRDGKFVKVGEGEWARAGDVHVVRAARPPKGIGPDEHWIDVDLGQQVVVAYRGTTPVYAALAATGKRGWTTRRGVFRIERKYAKKTLKGSRGRFHFEDVPWIMFYDRSFAIHSAYWHDSFGRSVSHGCVNVAPLDARFLFAWTEPVVPPGWSYIASPEDDPGSLVRIRR